MLDAGPYSEQAESRLRARQAVLEGLSESGFVPVDGEHIGFVTANWPPRTDNAPSPDAATGMYAPPWSALLLPWEECEAIDDSQKGFSPRHQAGCRGMVARRKFQSLPIALLRRFDRPARAAEIREKIDVRLIGPANSTGLQSMVREAAWDPLWRVNSDARDAKSTRWGLDYFASGNCLGS